MFTGIVQACGRVASVDGGTSGRRLIVDRTDWRGYQPQHGDSVCVDGVCLTVVDHDRATLAFDVVAETLARSTLGWIQPGDRVNLEAPVTPTTMLGGHFVQGHVDTVGRVTGVAPDDLGCRIMVEPGSTNLPAGMTSFMEAVIPKGSVAIAGVSLTVAAVGTSQFEVALIPTTLERTTLGGVQEGDRVNLEADMISKTVVHWLRRRFERGSSGVTVDTLRQAGFIADHIPPPGPSA